MQDQQVRNIYTVSMKGQQYFVQYIHNFDIRQFLTIRQMKQICQVLMTVFVLLCTKITTSFNLVKIMYKILLAFLE